MSSPPERELGPLTKVLRGRTLHDVRVFKDGMLVRCADGAEVVIEWGSHGAVLAGLRRFEPKEGEPFSLEQRFHFMRGKLIDCVRSEAEIMGIVMVDGHVLRCDWTTSQPAPMAVDVNVPIDLPYAVGSAGSAR